MALVVGAILIAMPYAAARGLNEPPPTRIRLSSIG